VAPPPKKRFGQHFLVDAGVIAAIVRLVAPRPGEALVEIGPGRGAITMPLLERCGALRVIELDRDLAARLRRTPGLEVIESDVLRVDFSALAIAGAIGGGLFWWFQAPAVAEVPEVSASERGIVACANCRSHPTMHRQAEANVRAHARQKGRFADQIVNRGEGRPRWRRFRGRRH
jgi:hypothetical protein